MKTKHTIKTTEYEAREIDEFGDAVDVHHFPTKSAAIAWAGQHIADGGLAAAVERHVMRRPAFLFDEPDTFTTLAVFGNREALDAWGWEPGESTWLESR